MADSLLYIMCMIFLLQSGCLIIAAGFLERNDLKYTNLNGTKVSWASHIDTDVSFPSSILLRYRRKLPTTTSKEGKKFISKLSRDYKKFSRKISKIDMEDS